VQRLLCLVAVTTALGCSSPEAAAFDAERPWRQPGDVIDSILPMEEHERRFREGLPEVATLSGGAPDRESLVRQFLDALDRRDSLALAGMAVNRAEFAWLIFPHHVYRAAPYELDPGIFWMQIQAGSAKGQARLLERLGGSPMTLEALDCQPDTQQVVSGDLTMWGPCQVRYATPDSTLERRLFGTMVEYGGRVKFLGYGNDF
jgi:hypothetical protein